ncbi:MAG: FdtA/QdtA family cupin domain-containing protein [Bacteroidaceae bacterium]|nr:FdtA/QdtA family cupin domain-containing protein [Bacteroidaceae bacterium]
MVTKRAKANKKVRVIRLGKIRDKRGNLSVVESGLTLPFEIARTYWVYDVPGGEARQGHAYYRSEEFIVALSGSFDLMVDDGNERVTFHLDQCCKGVYVPAGMWRHMLNFATNSIALVATSTAYSPKDYIRDYALYVELKKGGEL